MSPLRRNTRSPACTSPRVKRVRPPGSTALAAIGGALVRSDRRGSRGRGSRTGPQGTPPETQPFETSSPRLWSLNGRSPSSAAARSYAGLRTHAIERNRLGLTPVAGLVFGPVPRSRLLFGVVLIALLAVPSSSLAKPPSTPAPMDTATATGDNVVTDRFSSFNINVNAFSGPSGENPGGSVSFEM